MKPNMFRQVDDLPKGPITKAEITAFVFVIILTLFDIALTLGASVDGGRLSVVPTYDDVVYLVDGLKRHQTFETSGFYGLLQSLAHQPAHSPLTSLTAAIGFALTPSSSVGSYGLGGTWIVLFMALAFILLRGAPRLMRAGLLMALLAVPALGALVSEFRPDISWGVLTGFVSVLVLALDLAKIKREYAFCAGLLIGLDLISKPSGLPPTIVLLGTAYAISLFANFLEYRSHYVRMLQTTIMLLTGACVVSVPYFVVAGQEIIAYIRMVMLQDTSIWGNSSTLSDHMLFYERSAGMVMGWLWPCGLFFIGGELVYRVSRDQTLSPNIVRSLGALIIIAISYIIPSIAPVQSTYFGYIFYGPYIVGSLCSLSFLLTQLRVPPVAVAVMGGVIFFGYWTPDLGQFPAHAAAVVETDKVNRAIVPAVLDFLASGQAKNSPPVILNIAPAPVSPDILEYYSRLKGLQARFDSVFLFSTWEELHKKIELSDVVVVSDDGAIGQSPAHFPIYGHQEQIIATLRNEPSWHVGATYTDQSGHHTYAFVQSTGSK